MSRPQGQSATEGLSQRKLPVTPWRIPHATFWLVGQCLNQLLHRCLSAIVVVYLCKVKQILIYV